MYHIAPICLFRAPSHVLIEFIPITIPAYVVLRAVVCLLNLFACYFTRHPGMVVVVGWLLAPHSRSLVRLTPFEQSTLARVKI
jgi:hypothetical protein